MEEEEADRQFGLVSSSAQTAPPLVSLSPFCPITSYSYRRLPATSLPAARFLLSPAFLLVNAEEASSDKAIGGSLSRDEVVAWELFSPIRRFLIVAVIGVAVAESRKNRVISQLRKSVELRDQVLSSMQQKLDSLCGQLNSVSSKAGRRANKNVESPSVDAFGCDKTKFIDCGCWLCDQHQGLLPGFMVRLILCKLASMKSELLLWIKCKDFTLKYWGNSIMKPSNGDEVLQYKIPLMNELEPEERRMLDLSDWASSVTSTAEIQLNISRIDQDIFNVRRECEEKDATIKKLTIALQSGNIGSLKRIAELEDIIGRKNSMITKLKKDMLVLEQ